jgi:hypothetical protein
MASGIHVKAGGHKFVTGPNIFIFKTGYKQVLSLTHRPLYPHSKSPPICWIGCSEGFRARLKSLENGELLAPTDIQSAIVWLSNQYRSYCTD